MAMIQATLMTIISAIPYFFFAPIIKIEMIGAKAGAGKNE